MNFPRFYVPPGKFADDLRAGRVSEGTLRVSVKWERKTAVNYYACSARGEEPVNGKSGGAACQAL